jgi:hypothetical protein
MDNNLEIITTKTKSLKDLHDEYAIAGCIYPIPTEMYDLGNINEDKKFVKCLNDFVKLTRKISYDRECHLLIKTDSNKIYLTYLSYFLFHKKDDLIKHIGILSSIHLNESLKEMLQRHREGNKREDSVKPWLAISRRDDNNYKVEFMGILSEYKDYEVLVNPNPLKEFFELYSKNQVEK